MNSLQIIFLSPIGCFDDFMRLLNSRQLKHHCFWLPLTKIATGVFHNSSTGVCPTCLTWANLTPAPIN
jgi:hypothetical protein